MTYQDNSVDSIDRLLDELRSHLQGAKDADLGRFAPSLYAEANELLARLAGGEQTGEVDRALVKQVEQMIARIDEAIDAVSSLRRQVLRIAKTQQFVRNMEIGEAHFDSVSSAEALFVEALTEAKDGNLADALRLLDLAVAKYREVVVSTLEQGVLQKTRARLANARKQLPPKQFELLEQKIGRIEDLLRNSESEGFDAKSITYSVLSNLAELEDVVNAGELFAREPPCPDPVQPEITSISLSAPAPGDLLRRSDIYYVKGNEIDVTFVRPLCTMISSVVIERPFPGGSIELGTDPVISDDLEKTVTVPQYYTILSTDPEPDGRWRVSIRVHFPNIGDGRTLKLLISVSTFSGNLTETFVLTLVLVSDIGADVMLSISEAEFSNAFITGTYQTYGDDGRDESGTITLVDPDYDEMRVKIDETGISFRQKVKVDLPYWCNPTVTASGRFHITPNSGTQSFDVVWDDGPNVDISFPLRCRIPQVTVEVILSLVSLYFEGEAEDKVAQTIQNRVNAAFSSVDQNVFPYIQGVETHPGEIRVIANLPLDNVVVEIPYGRLRLDEVSNFGMALNPDEGVIVAASGLVDACTLDGNPTNCDTHRVGPAGLFNWSATPPIPSPWYLSEFNTYAYIKERHEAWKRLIGFRRDLAELPFPQRNVGAVIGRLENTAGLAQSHQFFGTPCTVKTSSVGESRLAFGNNDYRYLNVKEFGSESWLISVVWLRTLDSGTCASDSSTFEIINSTLRAIENVTNS